MPFAQQTPRPRRGVATLALVAILGATLFTLTQCQRVDEQLTGVRVQSLSAGSCIAACAQASNDSMRVESRLHVDNVHACAGDDACLAAESQRHEAAVDRIQSGRTQCQNDCHHQGGGRAGR